MKYREKICPVCGGDDFFAFCKGIKLVLTVVTVGAGLNGYQRKMQNVSVPRMPLNLLMQLFMEYLNTNNKRRYLLWLSPKRPSTLHPKL